MSDPVPNAAGAPAPPIPPATSRLPHGRGLTVGTPRHWWAVALRGACGILFGLIAVVQPFAALGSLVLLLGAYLLADGIFAIVSAVRAARHGERWGMLVVEGVLNIMAAGFAILLPGLTLLGLIWLLAGWSVVSGVMMVAAGWRAQQGRGWLILGGVLSVVWGVLLWLAPIAGAVVLSFWLGIYALAFGFVLLVLGFRLRARQAETPPTAPPAGA
ncbi:MAG: DUF308 domain-containing protein [Acetobacteraceae bacterium]|nr:DUF308 domain-containing protein [Acetobacteraceae bacterium]